jgi:hypothetical protein
MEPLCEMIRATAFFLPRHHVFFNKKIKEKIAGTVENFYLIC